MSLSCIQFWHYFNHSDALEVGKDVCNAMRQHMRTCFRCQEEVSVIDKEQQMNRSMEKQIKLKEIVNVVNLKDAWETLLGDKE